MQILIEVQDNKANFLMELLKHFPFIKMKPIDSKKSMLMKDIKASFEEIKQARAGKRKLQNARDLINEL